MKNLIMAAAINLAQLLGQGNAQEDRQGDSAWYKVETRLPAHELQPGVAADAINKRFEDGRAWPRHGVAREPWGSFMLNAVPAGSHYGNFRPENGYSYLEVATVIGRKYTYIIGNSVACSTLGSGSPDGDQLTGTFTATTTSVFLWSGDDILPVVTAALQYAETKRPRGIGRFNDPLTKSDSLILVTDDWRTAGGEDGGRGKAWRIRPGQAIQSIPLNGHDVWGESRVYGADRGVRLLRQGNERHYFQAAAIDTSTSRVQLNATPNWNNGDEVFFVALGPPDWPVQSVALGSSPPASGTIYFVKNIAGNKVELYTSNGLSTKLVMDGASAGAFYLERRATNCGQTGNGAPPLLMQPDGTGATAYEVGFKGVPAYVAATGFDGTTKILSAPNHRLLTSDKITYVHSTLATETFYVALVSDDSVYLYATVDKALANLSGDRQIVTPAWNAADYIKRDGASGLAMPPAREGAFLACNRDVLVNGENNLAISDALDPLHYTPYQALVTANLGEADGITNLTPIANDQLIVGKGSKVLLISGLSGANTTWSLTEITREYGFEAPLCAFQVGADVWGFGRKGVVSITQTVQGLAQGVAEPKSRSMQRYLEMIDWQHAGQVCGGTWNNRVFIAVPLKGQVLSLESGVLSPRNNAVLVYSTLNQGWEGMWQGDAIQIYNFCRLKVYNEERLCFVNYEGSVCYFSDDWEDYGPTPIADRLTTRMYAQQAQSLMTWLKAEVKVDGYAPKLTVTAVAPGYNERQVLLDAEEYDRTKYLVAGKADFDPTSSSGDFGAPDREDYSVQTGDALTGDGPDADIHQNVMERLRMRVRDWGVQIVIENAQGSARVQSVTVSGVVARGSASRQS